MYYLKHKIGRTLIEFTNSFYGTETVLVNGQVVSEKSSILGAVHHFKVMEDGQNIHYSLRTKVGGVTLVMIDLIRAGEYILQNEPVINGTLQKKYSSATLKKGVKKLRSYELDKALEIFTNGLNADPHQPQLHFFIACVHSLLEQKDECFHHLSKALENGLVNRSRILTEDALAYIRVQEEFGTFRKANQLNEKNS